MQAYVLAQRRTNMHMVAHTDSLAANTQRANARMHTDRQTDKCNLKSIYFYRLEHSVSAAFHFYLFSGIGSSLLVKM